jgi:hypothetical protein
VAEVAIYGLLVVVVAFLFWSTAAYWIGIYERGKKRLNR